MNDLVLGHLREARALLFDEKQAGKGSRELSIVVTEIDTAILWRQEDLRLKTPLVNETSPDKLKQEIAELKRQLRVNSADYELGN